MKNSKIFSLVLSIISIVLFIYVFDMKESVKYLTEINYFFVMVCLLFTFIYLYLIRSLFWLKIFELEGYSIKFYDVFKILVTANFSTLFISGRFNEPIYVCLFKNKVKSSFGLIVSFVIFERFLYFSLSFLFCMVGFFNYQLFIQEMIQKVSLYIELNPQVFIFFLLLFAVLSLAFFCVNYIRQKIMSLVHHLKNLFLNVKLLLVSIGIYGLWFFVAFFCNFCLFHTLPQDVFAFNINAFFLTIFITSITIVSGSVSFFPIGIGPGEFAFGAMLVWAGLLPEKASVFVLFSSMLYYLTVIVSFTLLNVFGEKTDVNT